MIKELELVKDGILMDYLIDTYNGKKINRQSNGRSSGTTNLYFENGKVPFEDLIKSGNKIWRSTCYHGAKRIWKKYSSKYFIW